MAAYDRRDLSKGAAVQTTLNGGISSGATSGVLTAVTGWPDGSPGAFYVVVDPGLTTEEKILCSTRSSTTLNFTTRGADGTSAAAHASGAVIYPCLAAVDLDEANLAVAKTLKLATAAGQILVVDAANSFAAVQAKTSGQILVGNGTTLASVAVSGDVTLSSTGVTAIGTGKVTSAMILDGTIAAADLAAGVAPYTTGAGAPAGDPSAAGNMYFDTTNNRLYVGNSVPKWVCITPVTASLTTGQTVTNDGSYHALGTTVSVTLITGTKALVRWSVMSERSGGSTEAHDASVAVSSATTLAAGTIATLGNPNGLAGTFLPYQKEQLYSSLTAGSNVFELQFKTFHAAETWRYPTLSVVGIP